MKGRKELTWKILRDDWGPWENYFPTQVCFLSNWRDTSFSADKKPDRITCSSVCVWAHVHVCARWREEERLAGRVRVDSFVIHLFIPAGSWKASSCWMAGPSLRSRRKTHLSKVRKVEGKLEGVGLEPVSHQLVRTQLDLRPHHH